jgi:DNA modification methylase
METNRILLGNNLDLLRAMPSNSVDSVVTDPPYGINFMNKKWDYDVPSVGTGKETAQGNARTDAKGEIICLKSIKYILATVTNSSSKYPIKAWTWL